MGFGIGVTGVSIGAELEFLDKSTENATKHLNSRAMTLTFDDQLDVPCPEVTSFLYSAGNRFQLLTPNFSLIESNVGVVINHNEEDKLDEITYQNRACRYVIAIRKFALENGVQRQLHLPKESPIPDLVKRLRAIATPKTPTHEQDAEIGAEIEGGKAIIRMNRVDPMRVGNTVTGTTFDTMNDRREFTGIMYFGPKSFTVFIVDAPTYRISFYKDKVNRSYEIEIASPESHINLSLIKEVLGNGWTTVFGD
jgi:hypothetical protein